MSNMDIRRKGEKNSTNNLDSPVPSPFAWRSLTPFPPPDSPQFVPHFFQVLAQISLKENPEHPYKIPHAPHSVPFPQSCFIFSATPVSIGCTSEFAYLFVCLLPLEWKFPKDRGLCLLASVTLPTAPRTEPRADRGFPVNSLLNE